MNSFRAAQCKPAIVQHPVLGKGFIVERRNDGICVVQLPWGKASVHNQSLGTVLSSQFKRGRNDDDETDDDDMDAMNDDQNVNPHSNSQDHRVVRRKIDIHPRFCSPASPATVNNTQTMSFQFQQPERMQS